MLGFWVWNLEEGLGKRVLLKKFLEDRYELYILLDYRIIPEAVYKPVDKILPRDENNMPIGEEDGAELAALVSIMVGAMKELNGRLSELENKM